MLALLCGGQGLVSAGMFTLTADAAEAQPVFESATALLGADPRALVNKPAEEITKNQTSQILSVTASLAHFAVLAPALPPRVLVTGYSVGEMAAWSLAGIWTAAEALRLTALRAQAMDEASRVPGRLCYVRGLGQTKLAQLTAAHGCEIAILSPDNLVTVGGPESMIEAFCGAALAEEAVRAEMLAVRVAAHTSQLAPAVPFFEAALRQSHWQTIEPGRQLLAGSNGERIFNAEAGFGQLAAQIAEPIDWVGTLDSLV
ncbi:MAG: acyltransferase domain-containing protein, partial [Rhodospirillales bacterium]|nr:acyltransferase domain-containing protein [Rhodospirillales bacterium]